ncbi:MAG: hypothetical protein AB9866_26255 [Syntrophobacteraceae bacterium]
MRGSGRHLTIPVIALFVSFFFLTSASLLAEEKSMPQGEVPLKIANFAFLQSKKGPSRPKGPYKPEDTVHTTFETAGFGVNRQGFLHLVVEMTVLDPEGLPLFEPVIEEILEPAKEKDSIDGYHDFKLPSYAPSGDYSVLIKVRDKVKIADHAFKQSFRVEGGPTEAPKKLELRECRFSATEGGPPAKPLTVKPGEKIYSSCKVAGMRFRENRIDVQVSVKIAGPSGKIIHDKPDLVVLKEAFFYHPPVFFEEISAWVRLPPDAVPGKHIWKYTVTDNNAGKSIDFNEEFLLK